MLLDAQDIFPAPLDIALSCHAEMRCIERGIDSQRIEEVLRYGTPIVSADGRLKYAMGRLCVVVDKETGAVITAYRKQELNPKRHIQRLRQERRKAKRRV